MSLRRQTLSSLVAILAGVGIVLSAIALYSHYSGGKSSYCDFGESFNCDIVNRSRYSEIADIPVALIGLLGYLGLLSLATVFREKPDAPRTILLAALLGLAFAFYLTYIEAFVLAVWCVLCLASLFLILSITVLSGLMMRATAGDSRS